MSAKLQIPILMYHQTAPTPPKGSPMRGLVVSPKTFARHMAALDTMGYRGLSMSGLEPYLRGEKTGKVVGITFDDGYVNNLEHALPVLKRHEFSSTCYAVASLVGKTNEWDADKGIAQVPLMNQVQMQAWVDGGQEIGSHAYQHCRLAELSPEQQWMQASESKALLESMIQQPGGVRHFCYPYGSFSDDTTAAVKRAGFITATTTIRSRVVLGRSFDDLRLPRVLVSRTTPWYLVLVKCMTSYEDR
jgi:peptidoglycan/xylan/chitin deacetylase (PgdA/CDA1 family)